MTTAPESHPDCPVRDYMDDPNITWRHGKPDYTDINRKYLAERSRRHVAGSLEKLVENLVKTWEMESSHKSKSEEWGTVDREKFTLSVNGHHKFTLEDNAEMGNYIMLLYDCPLLDVKNMSHDSSHELFRNALHGGFAWELLELTSGPPVVTFTWRHWGKWEGKYQDQEPTGYEIELYGCCVVRVRDDLKIQSIDVYFDPNPMMSKLTGFDLQKVCPVARATC